MTAGGRPRIRRELSASSWKRLRPHIKARDGNVCKDCGSNGWIPAHVSRSGRWILGRYRLVVGHRIPAEQYPGHHDDPANLKLQCVACNNSQRDLSDEQWAVAKAARRAAEPVRRPFGTTQTIFNRGPRIY